MNIQPYSLYCRTASTINNKPNMNSNKSSYPNPEIRKKFYYIPQVPIFFEALKKSKFNEMDLACVERFKAPIEKFNSNEDLQNWAKFKLKENYMDKDFGGRQEETKVNRRAMINEWQKYLTNKPNPYKPATALLIMRAVTKDLKDTNDNLPPVLNKQILKDTIKEISTNLKANKKYSFDMNRIYKHRLRTFYINGKSSNNNQLKWVIIPSQKHDPQHFESNVQKLKMLSYKTWCTKNTKAKRYLNDGDFHIYLENGNPKLCIRFIGDEVAELQGERNNGIVPCKYATEADKYFKKNKIEDPIFLDKIKQAEEAKTEFLKLQKKYKLPKVNTRFSRVLRKLGINHKKRLNQIPAFKEFGIDAHKLNDGTLSISQ